MSNNIQKIDLKTARQLAIQSQLLTSLRKHTTKDELLETIAHLGYVQIDTISVIRRAHHHVLWTRHPGYMATQFQALEEKDRQIFEYWAHAAAYLPMHDYRFSLVRKENTRSGEGHWYKRQPKIMKKVLERFKSDGPLMARDFKKETLNSNIPWMQHPVNQAIRQLYMEGTLMVCARKGFQKVYDLPEKILPDWVDQKMPTRQEYIRYLISRDLRAHGLIKAREIGYLLKNIRKDIQSVLNQMIANKEIIPIQIHKKEGDPYYIFRQALETIKPIRRQKKLLLLSPFDNLIIQRKRLLDLFHFDYTIECYVPEAKRKVGYFSLPMLWGTGFIGQIDLKADRKTKTLLVQNLVWEQHFTHADSVYSALNECLKNFASFNECTQIRLQSKVSKQKWSVRLEV